MSHQPLTELMPLERIHTVAPDMSKTHKKIAEYILENYESASFLTSVALAQKCGVSESVFRWHSVIPVLRKCSGPCRV